MLAKIVNDNAAHPVKRGALRFFASKFAPTGGQHQGKWLSSMPKAASAA
ncbi:hypothetical protein C4K02_4052 [Pseudomonas synxantha]|nr:hypothetical protein C4K02_4052 [Pseudomonas synxantha]